MSTPEPTPTAPGSVPESGAPGDSGPSGIPGDPRPAAKPGRARRFAAAAPLLSAAMLLAAAAWGLTLPSAADAAPHHARVRAAVAAAPLEVDGYRGRDAEVAVEAVELLRPNVILSRSFVDQTPRRRGEPVTRSPWAQLLIVQCQDARDILGHWPPVCYEANGYTPGAVEDTRWSLGGRGLPGRRYHFSKGGGLGEPQRIVVANFLVLPDGRVVRDMAEVIDAGGDYRVRSFGAAQVQVLTPGGLSEDARRRTEDAFLAAHAELIGLMASGVAAPPTAP